MDNKRAAQLYREMQANALILLVRTLLVTIKYFESDDELERETALVLQENKWPGGLPALVKKLKTDYPHFYTEEGKLKPFGK